MFKNIFPDKLNRLVYLRKGPVAKPYVKGEKLKKGERLFYVGTPEQRKAALKKLAAKRRAEVAAKKAEAAERIAIEQEKLLRPHADEAEAIMKKMKNTHDVPNRTQMAAYRAKLEKTVRALVGKSKDKEFLIPTSSKGAILVQKKGTNYMVAWVRPGKGSPATRSEYSFIGNKRVFAKMPKGHRELTKKEIAKLREDNITYKPAKPDPIHAQGEMVSRYTAKMKKRMKVLG